MSLSDASYYRDRARAERALALAADRQDVAAIHEELARMYQAVVDHAELRPTLRIVTDDQLRIGKREARDALAASPDQTPCVA